jgi:hypothetical protein
MVYLPDLVEAINGAIKKRLSKFADAQYYGIATQGIRREGDTMVVFPSVISTDGIAQTIAYDNKPPFILYHRAYNSSFAYAGTKKSYGDGDLANMKCSTVMRIICTGNRRDINISAEEFALIIADCLPTNMQVDTIPKSITITPSLIQYDSRMVFNGEFEKLAYFIGPDRFLFSIQYSIEGTYLKGCLNNCDC